MDVLQNLLVMGILLYLQILNTFFIIKTQIVLHVGNTTGTTSGTFRST